MSLLCVIVFSITLVAVTATPTNITGVGANCIITRFDQVSSVVNSCANIIVKDLVVNSGQSLTLILKPGTILTFQGTITFGYAEWTGPLVRITGNKIRVVGAPVSFKHLHPLWCHLTLGEPILSGIHFPGETLRGEPSAILMASLITNTMKPYNLFSSHWWIFVKEMWIRWIVPWVQPGSKFDGQGARWWDGTGDKGKKKPKFMSLTVSGGSVMNNINIFNCPHQCVSISSSNGLTISNWHLDSSAGDPVNGKLKASNTDGFDIGASHNIVLENVIVKNQDDCVCINDGTNMRFTNLSCYGGHGLSMAAGLSKTDYNRNVISNIHFENSHVINSRNGIHIKSVADGGRGKMTGITYNNIQMSGITNYAINVEQNYRNNMGPSGQPNNNVPVDGLTISGVSATMKGSFSMPVYILCASGACNNFKWSNINIKGNAKPSKCNIHPSGFNC